MNREKIAWMVSVVLIALLAFQIPRTLARRDDDYTFVRTLIDIHRQVSTNYVEPVDEQHPDLVAVMAGPLALFALGDRFLPFTRRELLSIRQTAAGSTDWRVISGDGAQGFKPYYALGFQTTRLYQPVSA